jgi:hypothetical protein
VFAMHVSIVASTASERASRQCQFFIDRGHVCQLYVEELAQAQLPAQAVATPAALLDLEYVRATALFLFHYVDEIYPLLETMRHLRHGLVVLDLCATTSPEGSPVHYADLCLVADVAHKRALHKATGYALERVYTLPERQDYEAAFESIFDQIVGGVLPQSIEKETAEGADMPSLPGDDLETTLLIRDSELGREAVLSRVRQAIQQRLAAGGYGPDVTALGPEALRPGFSGDDDVDSVDTLLWRFQIALDDLAAKSRMREPEFHSSVPVVGPLVVWVRRFWNWMSTKWYVRDWMAQQADFNAQAVDVISQLLQIQESNERHIHELELRLTQLGDEENAS